MAQDVDMPDYMKGGSVQVKTRDGRAYKFKGEEYKVVSHLMINYNRSQFITVSLGLLKSLYYLQRKYGATCFFTLRMVFMATLLFYTKIVRSIEREIENSLLPLQNAMLFYLRGQIL